MTSVYTGRTQVLTRGPGYFYGELRISPNPTQVEDEDYHVTKAKLQRLMESFLARLVGISGEILVPTCRPSQGTVEAGTTMSSGAASLVSGICQVSVSGHGSGRLVEGDYVSIDDRLYILVSDQAGSTIRLLPAVLPSRATTLVWEDVTCVGRLNPDSADNLNSLNPDFAGPWHIEWTESF